MTAAGRTRILRSALALALGVASGWAAYQVRMPLPWMLGPMIGNTVAALAGAPIRGPDKVRPLMIPVIGVLLGSSITSALFHDAGRWGATFLALVPFLALAAATSYVFYRRIGGYDPVTAFFSAMPGGLNDMLILGVERGGIEKRIALAHASRVLIVISFVGLFFGAVFGVRSGSGTGANWVPLTALTLPDWLILGACAVLGAFIGVKVRLPAAPILGPMILSGGAHIAEVVTVAPPTLLVIAAQITIGTVIGCRFLGATVREVGRDLAMGVGSSLLMIAVAVTAAAGIHVVTGMSLSQAFLAFSPGGVTEMGLLALAMEQDVAYVSVMHLARIMLVVFLAAPAFALLLRR